MVKKKRKPFTEKQPIEGERLLLCVHAAERVNAGQPEGRLDWFWIEGGLRFKSPSGIMGTATWVATCVERCRSGRKLDLESAQIGGDYVWRGNAPAIRKPEDDQE